MNNLFSSVQLLGYLSYSILSLQFLLRIIMLVTKCSSVDTMGSMLHVQSIATSTNPAICKPSINCMVSAGHWGANISKRNSEQGSPRNGDMEPNSVCTQQVYTRGKIGIKHPASTQSGYDWGHVCRLSNPVYHPWRILVV